MQIIGVLFFLYLIYKTYRSFQDEEFSLGDFITWVAVWIILFVIFAFPGLFRNIADYLQIPTLVELIFTILISFLILIVFHLYTRLNKLSIQFEESIQHIAQNQKESIKKKKEKR